MSDTIEKIKCLIIGSGPAGYTAAIYAARANMNPVLYQGMQPGGQLTTTNEVENFPGYVDGVTGPEMMVQLQAQAQRFGADIRDGWATKVDFSGDIHKVWINDSIELHCETVIISTGASAKYLGLPSEQHYLKMGGGVSACAVCDGFFYRNQEVVIVGAGDSACEEAHYLSKLCKKVTMLVRSEKFRASKIMEERVRKTENITILMNHDTVEVLGDEQVVTGVKAKNKTTGEIFDIEATGFFVAIGRCIRLIKYNWWFTFGLIIVVGFIQGFLGGILYMPNYIVMIFAVFTGVDGESSGLVKILYIISSIITSLSALLYVISTLAIAFQYYNLVERKEAPGLLQQIENIK